MNFPNNSRARSPRYKKHRGCQKSTFMAVRAGDLSAGSRSSELGPAAQALACRRRWLCTRGSCITPWNSITADVRQPTLAGFAKLPVAENLKECLKSNARHVLTASCAHRFHDAVASRRNAASYAVAMREDSSIQTSFHAASLQPPVPEGGSFKVKLERWFPSPHLKQASDVIKQLALAQLPLIRLCPLVKHGAEMHVLDHAVSKPSARSRVFGCFRINRPVASRDLIRST